jgi:hypothetical protein
MSEQEEEKGKSTEMMIGLLVAFFGAVLAIAGIGSGKYGGDQNMAAAEATKAYAWYQSKSIKNTSLEAQKDLLVALTKSGAIAKGYSEGVDSFIVKLETKSNRYKKEMKEILEGSDKVGKENWVQDKNGEFGVIIGAQEWEEKTAYLEMVGNWFNYTNLFLNLCLVLGAICLVINNEKTQKIFFTGMMILGIIGTLFCVYSFYLGWHTPYN